MGDLVAVMQVGGHLAQFAPPAEILAAPAQRVRGPVRRRGPWPQAAVARSGSGPAVARRRHGPRRRRRRRGPPADPGRPFPYLLLVDERQPADRLDRPSRGCPPAAPHGVDGRADVARSSTRGRRSRTRSRCCSTRDVQAGIVVDRDGAIAGLITVDEIAERMRQTAHQAAVAATPAPGPTGTSPKSPTPTSRSTPSRSPNRDRLGVGASTTSTTWRIARSSTCTWPAIAIAHRVRDLASRWRSGRSAARAVYGPIVGRDGHRSTRSRAWRCSRCSCRSPGCRSLTAEIPLILYTPAHLHPQHRGRLRQRAARRRSRRPTGWATRAIAGCGGSSCPWPSR